MSLKELRIKILMMRYGAKLSSKFYSIASALIKIRHYIRRRPDFQIAMYNGLVLLAKSRNIKIPKSKIKMEIEGIIDSSKLVKVN